MPAAGPSPLVVSMASEIARHIVDAGLPEGSPLTERKLSGALGVSRSPIRGALQLLEARGVVQRTDRGGFMVARVPTRPAEPAPGVEESRYRQIASDCLEGRLPRRVTENHLLRTYGFTRAELSETLRRISAEGWIERRPGYGWEFLPMLDSLQHYQDSYRFRLVIEPAAIMEPSFTLDAPALRRCREDQLRLVEGGIWDATSSEVFAANSALHEAIIDCSNNTFFSDGLRRVNRLRRLFEYKQELPREQALQRCREHIELVDMLLSGRNETAAQLMREHLHSVGTAKTRS